MVISRKTGVLETAAGEQGNRAFVLSRNPCVLCAPTEWAGCSFPLLEWLLPAFALSPLTQQRVNVRHAAHRQSLRYPCHGHERLLSQPHYNLDLLRIAFGSLTQHFLVPPPSAQWHR